MPSKSNITCKSNILGNFKIIETFKNLKKNSNEEVSNTVIEKKKHNQQKGLNFQNMSKNLLSD